MLVLALQQDAVCVRGRRDSWCATYWDVTYWPDFTLFPWIPAADVAFGLNDVKGEFCRETHLPAKHSSHFIQQHTFCAVCVCPHPFRSVRDVVQPVETEDVSVAQVQVELFQGLLCHPQCLRAAAACRGWPDSSLRPQESQTQKNQANLHPQTLEFTIYED